MARKVAPPEETLERWMTELSAAAEDEQRTRAEHRRAQDTFRACIRDAFDAGLSVTPISKATKLSSWRIYQIKRGTNGHGTWCP